MARTWGTAEGATAMACEPIDMAEVERRVWERLERERRARGSDLAGAPGPEPETARVSDDEERAEERRRERELAAAAWAAMKRGSADIAEDDEPGEDWEMGL